MLSVKANLFRHWPPSKANSLTQGQDFDTILSTDKRKALKAKGSK